MYAMPIKTPTVTGQVEKMSSEPIASGAHNDIYKGKFRDSYLCVNPT